MKLLVRLLLCLTVIAGAFVATPSNADTASKTTTNETASNNATPATASTAATATDSSTSPQRANSSGSQTEADVKVPIPPNVEQFFERMGLKQPTTREGALGYIGAILGLSSSIMLVTGAILPACLKRYNLLKGMLAVGIPAGIISLSIPSIVDASGSSGTSMGTVFVGLSLFFYMGVFFLPAIIAFREDIERKFLILIINVAGLGIPAAGLVALFLALKDKPSAQPHSALK